MYYLFLLFLHMYLLEQDVENFSKPFPGRDVCEVVQNNQEILLYFFAVN